MIVNRLLAELTPNPLNPRGAVDKGPEFEELVESIRNVGLLCPPMVTPTGLIVAGHRRVQACRAAGLREIQVIVRDITEAEQIGIMLAENIQRRELNPVQIARACQQMLDRGATREQVALQSGMSPHKMRAHLAILTLPEALQERCASGEMSISYAAQVARLETPQRRLSVGLKVLRDRPTVEQLTRIIDKLLGPPRTEYEVVERAPKVRRVEPRVVIDMLVEVIAAFDRQPELTAEPAVAEWVVKLTRAFESAKSRPKRRAA